VQPSFLDVFQALKPLSAVFDSVQPSFLGVFWASEAGLCTPKHVGLGMTLPGRALYAYANLQKWASYYVHAGHKKHAPMPIHNRLLEAEGRICMYGLSVWEIWLPYFRHSCRAQSPGTSAGLQQIASSRAQFVTEASGPEMWQPPIHSIKVECNQQVGPD
jgi:hypothetical protein